MDPAQWIASFRVSHDHFKRGTLNEDDVKKYFSMREELARSLMTAQGMSVPDGVPARRAFRVAQVFPIEVANMYRTMTREISCQGFTATVSGGFKEGEEISFVLTLARSSEPLSGVAAVTASARQGTNNVRLSAKFISLDEARLERIESALFESALARLG
jgi:hypothetical protein